MLLLLVLLLSAGGGVGLCYAAGGFEDLGWLWQFPVGFLGGFLLSAALAFGVLVLEVCKANGLQYYYGGDKMSYTSCFLLK